MYKKISLVLITVVLGLLWSWLLFVDVAQLSKGSLITGYGIAVVSFVAIVSISAYLFWRVATYLLREYKAHKKLSVKYIFKLFIIWAAAELLISWIITIVWIGEGGSADTVLPFGSFAPLLMYTPLGYLTRFVGYHGLSAVFVLLIFVLTAKKARRFAIPVFALVILSTVSALALYKDPNGSHIKAHITAEELDKKVPAIVTDADLVVLPEYGLDDIEDDTLDKRLRSSHDKEVFFVGSKQRYADNGEIENVLSFGSTESGFTQEFAKKRLIPGGEYLPYVVEVPLGVFGAQDVLSTFGLSRKIKKGTEPARPFEARQDLIIGAEACASIITPNDYRVLTRQGATVLVNSASLEIFRSTVFDVQHEGLGRFMAVANARPVLQSSNSARGFAIDHNGNMLSSIQPVNSSEVSLITNNKKTLYTHIGEWPAILGTAWLLFVSFGSLIRKHQKGTRVKK